MDICQIREGTSNTIYAIVRDRNDDPDRWLADQRRTGHPDARKLVRRIVLLADIGLTSNIEHYRHIKDALWEIKAGSLRMTYFQESTGICVLLGGFLKPTMRVQRAEFSKAHDLIGMYLEDKSRGLNRILLNSGMAPYVRLPPGAERKLNEPGF